MDTTATVVVCWLVADWVTGIVHWWEDTYGDPNWPILGPNVIEANIRHHESPTLFVTACNTLCRNRQPLGLLAAWVALLWACGWLWWAPVLAGLFASIGNQTHAWAHVRGPAWVRVLQKMGILQTPQQHAEHHKPPYDRAYCALGNIMNPLLDASRFFRGVEWLVQATMGVKPNRGLAVRRGR